MIEQIDLFIESPAQKSYPLVSDAKYSFDVEEVTYNLGTGSVQGVFYIGSTEDPDEITFSEEPLVFDQLGITNEETFTPTGNNSVAVGDRLELVIVADSAPQDFELSIKTRRT